MGSIGPKITLQRAKNKNLRPSAANRPNLAVLKPSKAEPRRTSDPAQARQSKRDQGQPKQGRSWETALVRANANWFAKARSRQKPAEMGERQLCRPDPAKHTPEAPSTCQSAVCVSAPVRNVQNREDCCCVGEGQGPSAQTALMALPVGRIVLNC